MDLWDGDKMSAMRFSAVIERVSAPTARLDVLSRIDVELSRHSNMKVLLSKLLRKFNKTSLNSSL